jgi:hypothetical protein
MRLSNTCDAVRSRGLHRFPSGCLYRRAAAWFHLQSNTLLLRSGRWCRRLRLAARYPRKVSAQHINGDRGSHKDRTYPKAPVKVHPSPVGAGIRLTLLATISFAVVSVSGHLFSVAQAYPPLYTAPSTVYAGARFSHRDAVRIELSVNGHICSPSLRGLISCFRDPAMQAVASPLGVVESTVTCPKEHSRSSLAQTTMDSQPLLWPER